MLLLQSAKPAVHAPLQTPPVHCAVTLLVEQTEPQPPQLLVELVVLISQPSASLLLLQSAKPAVHAPLQTPPVHCAVTLLVEQTVPQPPQLLVELAMLSSQPSASLLLLQSAKPGLQAPLHTPPPHARVTLLPEHAVPQLPQL